MSGMTLIKSLVSSLLEGSKHLKAQVYRRQHKSFTPPPLLCKNYIIFLVQNKKNYQSVETCFCFHLVKLN